ADPLAIDTRPDYPEPPPEGQRVLEQATDRAGLSDPSVPQADDLPRTLEQIRDWLVVRVRWLREWHLAKAPKPLPHAFLRTIVSMFRADLTPFPSTAEQVPAWASEHIWLFSERTIHQAHNFLERLGVFDAPAWHPPDIFRNPRILIEALDHLSA